MLYLNLKLNFSILHDEGYAAPRFASFVPCTALGFCFAVITFGTFSTSWCFFSVFTDSIEANVERSAFDVERGTEQLLQARNYQVR